MLPLWAVPAVYGISLPSEPGGCQPAAVSYAPQLPGHCESLHRHLCVCSVFSAPLIIRALIGFAQCLTECLLLASEAVDQMQRHLHPESLARRQVLAGSFCIAR